MQLDLKGQDLWMITAYNVHFVDYQSTSSVSSKLLMDYSLLEGNRTLPIVKLH